MAEVGSATPVMLANELLRQLLKSTLLVRGVQGRALPVPRLLGV